MKKLIVIILCSVCVILSIFTIKYMNYKSEQTKIKEENLEYEAFLNKQILGTELTTFINKAIDNNIKNNVLKDEKGFYIQNDSNSIEIEIKITDNNKVYKMEAFYNGGMIDFLQNYNLINFECTKIKYNKIGKVSYMLFEQKSN